VSSFFVVRSKAQDPDHDSKRVEIKSGSSGHLADVTSDHALKVNIANDQAIKVVEASPAPLPPTLPPDENELGANSKITFHDYPKTLIVCVINGTYSPDFLASVNGRDFPMFLNGQTVAPTIQRSMCASVPPFRTIKTNGNVIEVSGEILTKPDRPRYF
jgi:hypothetical protein